MRDTLVGIGGGRLALHIFLPFTEHFDANASELLQTLLDAHRSAATANPNASKQLAITAFAGSGNLASAIIAGMSCIGGLHAPLTQARTIYRSATYASIRAHIDRIPGFGNSFYPDSSDPSFHSVEMLLAARYPKELARIGQLTEWIGLPLHPNAALYTAAVCEILGLPDGIEPMLFAIARIPVWAKAAIDSTPPRVGVPVEAIRG